MGGLKKTTQARLEAMRLHPSAFVLFSRLHVVVVVGAVVIAHLAHVLVLLAAGLAVKLLVHLLQQTSVWSPDRRAGGRTPVKQCSRTSLTRLGNAPQHLGLPSPEGVRSAPPVVRPRLTWTCSLMVSCLTAFSSLLAFISSVSTTSESSFFRSFAASSVNLQHACRTPRV